MRRPIGRRGGPCRDDAVVRNGFGAHCGCPIIVTVGVGAACPLARYTRSDGPALSAGAAPRTRATLCEVPPSGFAAWRAAPLAGGPLLRQSGTRQSPASGNRSTGRLSPAPTRWSTWVAYHRQVVLSGSMTTQAVKRTLSMRPDV